jgi:hypothetical protein
MLIMSRMSRMLRILKVLRMWKLLRILRILLLILLLCPAPRFQTQRSYQVVAVVKSQTLLTDQSNGEKQPADILESPFSESVSFVGLLLKNRQA